MEFQSSISSNNNKKTPYFSIYSLIVVCVCVCVTHEKHWQWIHRIHTKCKQDQGCKPDFVTGGCEWRTVSPSFPLLGILQMLAVLWTLLMFKSQHTWVWLGLGTEIQFISILWFNSTKGIQLIIMSSTKQTKNVDHILMNIEQLVKFKIIFSCEAKLKVKHWNK